MAAPSHLKSLQAIELAVRTGSFAAAAELLAITPAAVGQRVKALEDYLGVELILRGRSGIKPTEALLRAAPELARGFAAIEAASALLDMQRPRELHIAVEEDFAVLWLAPRLASFRARYPHIGLCINGVGDVPMRLGRADCEIFFGAALEEDDCELLFHDLVLPVASPANVERTGALPPAERLEGFPLLHLDFYKDDPAGISWPRWFALHGLARTAPERGMRFQRIVSLVDAVLADAGIALCGAALVTEAIDEGRLAVPFPVEMGWQSAHAFIALFPPKHSSAPTVGLFRSWLKKEAAGTSVWLARFVDGAA